MQPCAEAGWQGDWRLRDGTSPQAAELEPAGSRLTPSHCAPGLPALSPGPHSAPLPPSPGYGHRPFSGNWVRPRRGSVIGGPLRPSVSLVLAQIWGPLAEGGAAWAPTLHTDTSKMPQGTLVPLFSLPPPSPSRLEWCSKVPPQVKVWVTVTAHQQAGPPGAVPREHVTHNPPFSRPAAPRLAPSARRTARVSTAVGQGQLASVTQEPT